MFLKSALFPGNVVFSLKTNCYSKDDEFSKRVMSLLSPRLPLAILSFVLPSFISEYFDISLFDSKTVQYFAGMTLGMMEERKKRNQQYNGNHWKISSSNCIL